jgi:hypothetical protein
MIFMQKLSLTSFPGTTAIGGSAKSASPGAILSREDISPEKARLQNQR